MEYVLAARGFWSVGPCRFLTSIATVPTTGAPSRRCTAACSGPTPPTPAACAGSGSTARNPNNPGGEPEIWIAREGPAIIGQYATMPVRLAVKGREVTGSWGMDVMVAPERQRRGLGEVLFRTWDRNVGASLGLGLSDASYRLFQKLKWPDVGPVPCLVKPLSRRAFRHPRWPVPINRFDLVPHLAAGADRLALASAQRRGPRHPALRRELHGSCGNGWRRSSTSRSGATPRT